MKRWLWIAGFSAFAAALFVAAACGDDEEDGGTPAPTATTAPAQEPTGTPATGEQPSVTIVEPADGATVPAGDVTVTVEVSNFEVVDRLNAPAAPGEGHVHFYMDVADLPTTPGQPAVSAQGTYHASATTTYTWPDVPPGEHTFAVQLVNNDHTPLEPPVVAEVTVTVQ
ncbi:MAG TPA: DUF4399 domain-containing protein [Dehalococcoidia bacterium]|nr:DUF4399 domain-containing protein [Dehalococcoidia bacterium]